MSSVAMLGVPTSAGAHFPGLEKGPAHLRRAGLVPALEAAGLAVHDLGDTATAMFSPDPARRAHLNLDRVAAVATEVAARVAGAYDLAARLLVLGGDCSLTAGVVAGLAHQVERLGLLYVDANVDLNTPDTTRTGALDSMGMSHLIGLGCDALGRIGPRFPLLADEEIVLFGFHPDGLNPGEGPIFAARAMHAYPMLRVRDDPSAAGEAVATLEARTDGFLVHFDVDVVDFIDFPAANIPHYHDHPGATLAAVTAHLARFAASPKFLGLTVTEFNPDHDPDGVQARRLVRVLRRVLANGTGR